MADAHIPPPIETATDPVHCAADLGRRWRALMGELGFGERLLWFGFLGADRRMAKSLHQIAIPRQPRVIHGEELFALLRDVLAGLGESDVTVALLLTGPGRGPVSDADRRWATMLTDTATRFEVPIEPIFRANDESLLLVEPTAEAA
jgi:hypothetical protein